tara:strand:- start:2567 stop:2908 length:342 start_codon:yes stop_codon:yes gene_type:complete
MTDVYFFRNSHDPSFLGLSLCLLLILNLVATQTVDPLQECINGHNNLASETPHGLGRDQSKQDVGAAGRHGSTKSTGKIDELQAKIAEVVPSWMSGMDGFWRGSLVNQSRTRR